MTTDVSTVFASCCVQGFQDIRPRTSDGGESFYSLSVAVRMRYKFRRSNPCDARGSHGLAPHKPLVVSRTSGRSAGGYRSASARPSHVFFATVGCISMVCMCSHSTHSASAHSALNDSAARRPCTVTLSAAKSLHSPCTCTSSAPRSPALLLQEYGHRPALAVQVFALCVVRDSTPRPPT